MNRHENMLECVYSVPQNHIVLMFDVCQAGWVHVLAQSVCGHHLAGFTTIMQDEYIGYCNKPDYACPFHHAKCLMAC